MLEFLTWLEAAPLGQALRGSGVWTYGVLNLFHILGISTLFGSILMLDLRLLGLWKSVPLALLVKPTVPLAAGGVAVAVLSGICMISVNATDYYGNPFLFYFKFPAIVLGLINILMLRRLPAWRVVLAGHESLSREQEKQLALHGGISLLIWLVVLSSGRMIAYW